jgi:glyoxylase-like metal-dependent hydrolase (beta-lactamase superfamily II)
MRYHLVSARNPGVWTGDGNNTYLLPGRVPTLIDAGVGEPAHAEEIAALLGGSELSRVIVTHAHSDHAAGAPALAARWPRARFEKLPWPDRDARWAVPWSPLADGDEIEAGDARLRVIHTPGHSPDHIALFHPASRTLFCADLVVSGSTVVIPAGRGGDLASYLNSLARVLALEPLRLLPAHGEAIDDPARVLNAYIGHRQFRERQILSALASGPLAVEALVSQIYPNIRPELREAALGSMLAHLIKLRDEGRAIEEGERWRLSGTGDTEITGV